MMPNWNSNSINIEGPADTIRALWAAAQPAEGKDGSLLEAMAPIGEWEYDTAVAAWGTKWDVSLEGLEFVDRDNGRAAITGWADSAWSPPIEAFQTYAEKNPDVYLELKYFEPGMSFIGVWDSNQGDTVWEVDDSLLLTTEEEDPVLYGLLEHFNASGWYDTDEEEEVAEENFEIDVDGNFRVNE
jgi:hypothetical protein